MKKYAAIAFAWIAVITGLHMLLNVNWQIVWNDRLPLAKRRLNVAYVPVT